MYQSNGPNHIKAIDPREAEVLWSYTYAVPNDVVLCCDDNNRGPAVFGDKVFMTTLDSGVVALDRYTGEEEWYTSTEDHERGYSATWAPMIYDGTLFTGSAGGEYGVRGFHTALDTESGDEKWRINVSPEEEWVGDSIEQSSCTNWMTATVDHENGRLYMPIGNPGPDFDGSVRPGPNRMGTIDDLPCDRPGDDGQAPRFSRGAGGRSPPSRRDLYPASRALVGES
jgi:glucose dehydrogenase